jgi:hypothetical protein
MSTDVYLFPRMKYNSVIYCDTRYAWPVPYWIFPVNYGTALYDNMRVKYRSSNVQFFVLILIFIQNLSFIFINRDAEFGHLFEVLWFTFLKRLRLFGFQIYWLWAYLVMVIPEMRGTHKVLYLAGDLWCHGTYINILRNRSYYGFVFC